MRCLSVMSFLPRSSLSSSSTSTKPLLSFSTNTDRAFIVSAPSASATGSATIATAETSMTKRRTARKRTAASRRGRRLKGSVRLTKGRLSLRVAGYPGYHRIAASQLVRYVPLAKLKQAAKRVLGASGKRRSSRKRVYRRRRRR